MPTSLRLPVHLQVGAFGCLHLHTAYLIRLKSCLRRQSPVKRELPKRVKEEFHLGPAALGSPRITAHSKSPNNSLNFPNTQTNSPLEGLRRDLTSGFHEERSSYGTRDRNTAAAILQGIKGYEHKIQSKSDPSVGSSSFGEP